jgi:antirestriction protein ArdC
MEKKLIKRFYDLTNVERASISELNTLLFDFQYVRVEDVSKPHNRLVVAIMSKLEGLTSYMELNELDHVNVQFKDEKFKKEIVTFLKGKSIKNQPVKKHTINELQGLGLPYLKAPIEQEGLGKAVDVYQMVTDKILEKINSKDFEFGKKWDDYASANKDGYMVAFNFVSKKPYRSINQLLLGANPLFQDALENPFYLTFKQVDALKGKVKKGAKGHQVTYYTVLYSFKNEKGSISTYDKKKFIEWLKKQSFINNNSIPSYVSKNAIPIIKYYNVFNGSDIEGINFKLDKFNTGKIKAINKKEVVDIKTAENIIASFPEPQIVISHENQPKAYYSTKTDSITMPTKRQFENMPLYYSTVFHEAIHASGSKKRLNRDLSGRFGTKKYAFEELIAEVGASFLSAESGLLHHHIKHTAAYLKSWLGALSKELKKDKKFIFKASSSSQLAADYLLQVDKKGVPAYRKKTNTKSIQKIKKTVRPRANKIPVKSKVNKKGQFALFGLTPFSEIQAETIPSEKFKISGSIKEILGNIEVKPVGSVAVTLDAPQGAGKTRFTLQAANEFAKNYNVLYVSLEEHPASSLFKTKVEQYLTPKSQSNFYVIGELENGFDTLKEYIPSFDVIIIDSWTKIIKMSNNIEFDDLRKNYNSKLFMTIFQRTQDGKMRGGSEAQFDGDVILKISKQEDFRNNFVYADKNRYQNENLSDIKYSIYSKNIIKEKQS